LRAVPFRRDRPYKIPLEMINRLNSLIEGVAGLGGYLSGWLVPLMMILVVVEVFMRYVLQRPLMVADEFSAYMLVALSFIGLAYTWRQGGHVRITILVNRLSRKPANWVRLGGLVAVFVFMIAMDQSAYKMVRYALQLNMKSSTFLMIPLFWPQLTVLVGFVLLTLLVALDIIQAILKIRAGKKVEEMTL
jgi:TRAP-type C4-dicarboxylate transport system permease small subunit